METENLDVNEFVPPEKTRKAKKRSHSEGDKMIVDEEAGVEGKEKDVLTQVKRKKGPNAEIRKIPVPPHRYTPLKENWMKIFSDIVEHLKLQIRFNMKARQVELRMSPETPDISNLQKAAEFVQAFLYGFEVDDALALLRLEDLFIETFEIKDVKTLGENHMKRAIGRIAGEGGRTKFIIENVTKTRIILADSRIHILGSYQNIQLARRAICNLILGSPPNKVYGNLRSVASRISERF